MKAPNPAITKFLWQLSGQFSGPAQLVFLLALTGCSAVGIENKRIDYKAGSVKARPLDVPPDLTALVAGDRFVIPDSGGEIVTSYSEYSKGEPTRQRAEPQFVVLPEVPNVHVERSGTERWLVTGEKAENVWPKVKALRRLPNLSSYFARNASVSASTL